MKCISINNYYGSLMVKEENNKYYWLVENFDTNLRDLTNWFEIPKLLYLEVVKWEKNLANK